MAPQYLFLSDSDEGRFFFLRLMAKAFALRLDTSEDANQKDSDQDVYRFIGQINNNHFHLIHPLSSIDGLRSAKIEADKSDRAFILLNAKKYQDNIKKNLIKSAELLGYIKIHILIYETELNSEALIEEMTDMLQSDQNLSISPEINFHPQQKQKITSHLAEICWLGTFPFESGESLIIEMKQSNFPVTISAISQPPTRIIYGESAEVMIEGTQSDIFHDNFNVNQSFVLKRNGVMISRGRWIGGKNV